jgi:hypothetical protein
MVLALLDWEAMSRSLKLVRERINSKEAGASPSSLLRNGTTIREAMVHDKLRRWSRGLLDELDPSSHSLLTPLPYLLLTPPPHSLSTPPPHSLSTPPSHSLSTPSPERTLLELHHLTKPLRSTYTRSVHCTPHGPYSLYYCTVCIL